MFFSVHAVNLQHAHAVGQLALGDHVVDGYLVHDLEPGANGHSISLYRLQQLFDDWLDVVDFSSFHVQPPNPSKCHFQLLQQKN